MKIRILPFLAVFFITLAVPGFSIQPGEEVPGFSVVSGSGQMLIRNDIREQTVLLFYEDRNQLDSNKTLKEYIESLDLDTDTTMVIVIVDCSDVGLFKKLWEDKLVDYSRKSRQPVYGDWNGKMKDKFHFQDDTSSFLIINPSGKVVYAATGDVAAEKFSAVSGLLK